LSGNQIIGQTRSELESRKSKNLEEIEQTKKLLEETTAKRKNSLGRLLVLNRRIELRQQVINSTNGEINLVEDDIVLTQEAIREINREMEKLKEEYAKIIFYAFKNSKEYDQEAYIFAADNFNQAYKRMKYLKQYSQYRKQQARKIEEKKIQKEEKLIILEQGRNEKARLMREKEREVMAMTGERKQKQSMVNMLRSEERQIKGQLRKREEIARNLEAAITRMIEEEARNNRDLASLTPEEQLLADNFKSNRGKLPWPTERGVITGYFGERPHPVLTGVKISNNGIDIQTPRGTLARAIFEGEVRKVVSIPGANKVVIISHGNYLSMYSNLVDVFVIVGEKVALKQDIGLIFSDEENDNETMLHLEIWEQFNKLDPVGWLSNR
jgi:septal ring factor EnvC (AmiA/AmiB activator)